MTPFLRTLSSWNNVWSSCNRKLSTPDHWKMPAASSNSAVTMQTPPFRSCEVLKFVCLTSLLTAEVNPGFSTVSKLFVGGAC